MMVGNAAADRSVNAYLVGGSVRDLILGGRIDDLDVCIESGDIQEFCEFLQTTFLFQFFKNFHDYIIVYYYL